MADPFVLFIDVMGVKRLLDPEDDSTAHVRFADCRDFLSAFHSDLANTIEHSLPAMTCGGRAAPPRFVAEFSDSAYVAGECFASVAAAGILMMRKALRHEYPLRGGLGVGSFSHEATGVRTRGDGQVWSSSLFLGGGVVTAYECERSSVLGLRILVHERVMRRTVEPFLQVLTVPLPPSEVASGCTHELRLWNAREAPLARLRLSKFRDKQTLSERAARHYAAADAAYERFGRIEAEFPLIMPAMWL